MANKNSHKQLIKSLYRREMWKNVKVIVGKISKSLPISSMHIMGSFVSKKKRPADVDFIVMLRTPAKRKKAKWSVDLVIAPDNDYGKTVFEDAKKWTQQRYGSKKSAIIRYK